MTFVSDSEVSDASMKTQEKKDLRSEDEDLMSPSKLFAGVSFLVLVSDATVRTAFPLLSLNAKYSFFSTRVLIQKTNFYT